MGNSNSGNSESKEERTKRLGKRRYEEYLNSPAQGIRSYVSGGGQLKYGDIIWCNTNSITDNSTIGTKSARESGLSKHYAIYADTYSQGKHYIIEKFANKGTENPIKQVLIDHDELMKWNLVVNSRYEDTYSIACNLMNGHFDGGYSYTHANCEHFVTYCLCRNTRFSTSRQVLRDKVARAVASFIPNAATTGVKLITHPLYRLAGNASLDQRIIKAALPFGQGIDEDGIALGHKSLLGYSVQSIRCWFPFPDNLK